MSRLVSIVSAAEGAELLAHCPEPCRHLAVAGEGLGRFFASAKEIAPGERRNLRRGGEMDLRQSPFLGAVEKEGEPLQRRQDQVKKRRTAPQIVGEIGDGR